MNRRALTAFVGIALSVAVGVALAPYIGALVGLALAVLLAGGVLVGIAIVVRETWRGLLGAALFLAGIVGLERSPNAGNVFAYLIPWVVLGAIALIAVVAIVTSRSSSDGGLRRR